MPASQDGLCAVCRVAPAAHVYHDHETGRVRAMLCLDCNGGLGQSKDDPGLLHLAALYVEHHRERQASEQIRRAAAGPEGADRPGEPPVGSQRRPGGTRGTRSPGRTSGRRRQSAAGEVDG